MTQNTKTTDSPSKFQVGDIVTWESENNKWWHGGKAEVVSLFSEKMAEQGIEGDWITVRVLEEVPVNPENSKPGTIMPEYPRNLKLVEEKPAEDDAVDGPAHYGGKDNPYEVIKVAEAWGLDKDSYLFNVLKYIGRADKKGASLQDHKKARYYLDRKIARMEEAK